MEDYAYIELDRNEAPAGAMLHMTIYDQQLNFDPTYEDTVVFRTNASYGVSFNNTAPYRAMDSNHFGDNGQLKLNLDASGIGTVLQMADNDDCLRGGPNVSSLSERAGAQPAGGTSLVCFTETGTNTGIFTNGDDADVASLNITTTAKRGATATIDYNDSDQSQLVTTTGATIEFHDDDAGDVWTSGEIVGITLTDPD